MLVKSQSNHHSKIQFSDLAEKTFNAFRPYINIFDPGRKDVIGMKDGELIEAPYHTIPKETWILNKQWKEQKQAGQKPCVFWPDGTRFNSYLDISSKVLAPHHCDLALQGKETLYYTSGKDSLGIAYLDTDAHFDFQTDAAFASNIVMAAFPTAFHCLSSRGFNELLKVYHGGAWHRFNELCHRLQKAMQVVFNAAHVLCDFEVKGTCTGYVQDEEGHKFHKSGSLAKLPWNRRWNFERLDQWNACATLSLDQLERIVAGLEQNHDDATWAAHRQALKDAETEAKRPTVKVVIKDANQDAKIAPQVAEIKDADHDAKIAPQVAPSKLSSFATANANPDRLRANIDIGRLLAQQLKRVPTVDEFLSFLKSNGFYTGSWEQTATKRRERCKFVLRAYVEAHFDPSKLGTGTGTHYPINLDRWNKWAKQFPETWTESYDHKGRTVNHHLTRDDARVYQEINFVLLKEHPNADSSVPYAWIMCLWQDLYNAGKTTANPTQDKIGALRACFHARSIILITDPNYSPAIHKAIRYKLGSAAPGQSDYWTTKGQKPQTIASDLNTDTHTTHISISRHSLQVEKESCLLTIPRDTG